MTMPIIPQYLVGRNVSLASITLINVDNAGATIAGAVSSLKSLGVFKSFEYEAENNGPDIHPADAILANYQPGLDDFTVTVGELQDAAGGSQLATAYYNNMYLRVACQASAPAYGTGSALAGLLFAAILRRTSLKQGFIEGENAVMITLKPCGIAPYWGVAGAVPF